MSNPTLQTDEATTAWRMWIAENILRGADPRAVAKQMIADAGVTPEHAEQEVIAALSNPYMAAARRLQVGAGGAAGSEGGGSSARADKYAWWMEVSRRTEKLSRNHGIVPRIPYPANDAFLEVYYAPGRPCVIEGAIDDWPALTKWTPEYFKATCGDQMVEVEGGRNDAGANLINVNRKMRFADYVDIVQRDGQSDDWYLTAQNDAGNGAALAALWDDVRLPDFLTQDAGPIGGGFLWYGPGGTLSPTHHDLSNNLMAQVIGRKRVHLVAPNESAHLYNHYGRQSRVSLEQPDLEAFPALADVTILETEIGPGDLLFIPAGWWHSVRALDVSFTFTFTNFIYDGNDYHQFFTPDVDYGD